MESFFVVGGRLLKGEVEIDPAKNSLLPILAGCILVKGEVYLENVPKYSDVMAMIKILEHLGGKVKFERGKFSNDNLIIDTRDIVYCDVPNELSSCV